MDLEKSLLNSFLTLNSLRRAWDLGLREQVFVDPVNRSMYRFITEYWLDSAMTRVPTEAVLTEEFPGQFKWEETEETVDWLIQKIQGRFISNQVKDVMMGVSSKVVDEPVEALRELQASSWEISQNTSPRRGRSDLSENVELRRVRYAERATYTDSVRGAPFGFPLLDEHTYGLLPGELGVYIAFAGVGKSWGLGNAFVAMRRSGWTPCLFTLELSVEDFEDRIDAISSGLPYTGIQRGQLEVEQVERLRTAQQEFASLGPSFIEKPPRGERTVPHLINRARQLGADVVLIDQLSFMETRRNHQARHEGIEEIIFDLKAEISEKEDQMIPVLLAVQFNRESQSHNKGRGALHQIALSSSIEQTIDIGFALSQTQEHRVNRSMVIDALKLRRGDTGAWLAEWDLKNRTRFGIRGEITDGGLPS